MRKNISFALITEEGEIISLNFRCCTRAMNFSQGCLCLCWNYNTESWSDCLGNKIILNHRIRREGKGKGISKKLLSSSLVFMQGHYPNAIPKWCLIYTCRLKYSPVFCRKSIPVPSSILWGFPGALVVLPGWHLNVVISAAVGVSDGSWYCSGQTRPSTAAQALCWSQPKLLLLFFVCPSIIVFLGGMTEYYKPISSCDSLTSPHKCHLMGHSPFQIWAVDQSWWSVAPCSHF